MRIAFVLFSGQVIFLISSKSDTTIINDRKDYLKDEKALSSKAVLTILFLLYDLKTALADTLSYIYSKGLK